MSGILLIGEDWTTRALLRAELLEEGIEVEAFETAVEAVRAVEESGGLPSLIVADVSSSADPEGDVDELARRAREVPIWIIAGKTVTLSKLLTDRGFEEILFKPLDVGELVKRIKRRLE